VDDALKNLELNAEVNFLRMVERDALILKHEGVVPVFTLQPDLLFEQRHRSDGIRTASVGGSRSGSADQLSAVQESRAPVGDRQAAAGDGRDRERRSSI
jgi:hypothetical protein